jgi:hypothetical protein
MNLEHSNVMGFSAPINLHAANEAAVNAAATAADLVARANDAAALAATAVTAANVAAAQAASDTRAAAAAAPPGSVLSTVEAGGSLLFLAVAAWFMLRK